MTMLEDNLEAMKKNWDPNHTFGTLVQQIENAMDLAEEGEDPISARAQLNCGHMRVCDTGLFNDQCHNWHSKSVAGKMWTNFKTFFADAQDDFIWQHATQSAGHHQANNAAMEQFTADTRTSVAKLANAAVTD